MPSLRDLPWLPAAPADVSARIRALAAAEGALGQTVQQLAGTRLDASAVAGLGRALKKARARGADLAPLTPFRLGLLSNATTDFVAEALPAGAARHGVALDLVSAPYGQVMQQALDPASVMNAPGTDAVLLALDHRWLGLDRPALDGDPAAPVETTLQQLRAIVEALRAHSGAPAILQTVAVPPLALFGSLDRRIPGSPRALIEEANRRLVGLAEETGALLLDVAALAERVGTDQWFDPVRFAAYKLPFAPECVPLYADALGRLLGAARGRAKKCLVLDLDNTVWGGVIGDDGLDGIKLGQGSPVGEAFVAVQRLALDLRERGILLAVSSKNTDAVARQAFREHPEMLLKEEHITVFQANWNDKPSNLEAIARELNIGVDALVLLDDNPAERAHVRAALPVVGVPELPSDPAWYPWTLAAAGYFEAVSFASEDRVRAAAYAADARRADVRAVARDLDDYLASLGMVMEVSAFEPRGRARIAQLINKTNQFNLTTRRLTEAEVAALETDPNVHTMQVRLEDRFGDLGMIAVVVARACRSDDLPAWDLDLWLMSCRVLGRKVEEAMLASLVAAARANGVPRLLGRYVPTAKNAMVADHYERLGFRPAAEQPDGGRRFWLDVSGYVLPDLPMSVSDTAARKAA